jgi:hypothetical protein
MSFEKSNERWQFDFKGPLRKGPHELYFVFVIDRFDCFCWGRAFLTKDAEPVALWLLQKFEENGCPEVMQSDNGKDVKNSFLNGKMIFRPGIDVDHGPKIKILIFFFAEVYACFEHLTTKTVPKQGRPYHPQSNGGVEKVNQTIMRIVRAICFQNKIVLENLTVEEAHLILLRAINTYNNACCSSTDLLSFIQFRA